MKKRYLSLCCLFAAVLVIGYGIFLSAEQRKLSQKIIRLHVVANSDSEQDQNDKMKLRDFVLSQIEDLGCMQENAQEVLKKNLPELQSKSQAYLRSIGNLQPVSVSLKNELFPTREYDTFSLPAGVYQSLRVTMGEGNGHNWWCVIFPSICLTANMRELELACTAAGFSYGELKLITQADDGYCLKFKTMEILQSIKNRIADN